MHVATIFHNRLIETRQWDDFARLAWRTRVAVIQALCHHAQMGLHSGNGAAQEARQAVAALTAEPWLAALAGEALERLLAGRSD